MGKGKVHGVLYFGKHGRAKVHVEGHNEPIALAKGSSGTAIHGDTVELYALPPKKKKFDRKKGKENRPKPVMKYGKLLNVEPKIFLAICEKI